MGHEVKPPGARREVGRWTYYNAAGQTADKVRFEPKGFTTDPAEIKGPFMPLYRFDASHSDCIVIAEGEKTADAIIAAGFQATTGIGGSNAASTDWSELKDVPRLVLWPDNDDPGFKFGRDVRNILDRPIHRVDISNMPHKGDAADLEPGAIRAMIGAALEADPVGFEPEVLRLEDMSGARPDPREWLVHNVLPKGRLSALYGTGGAGKSRLALQLAAAVIWGGHPLKYIGSKQDAVAHESWPITAPIMKGGKVIWATWEDEADEIKRRLYAAADGGLIADQPDWSELHVVNMRPHGAIWNGDWTAAGRDFIRMIRGYDLAVVDPVASAYEGNENDRAAVRSFTSKLDAAAEHGGCTVLLIGHPPKAGDEGYSGSTDWQASVRSMLVIDLEKVSIKGEKEGVAMRLKHTKSNYSLSMPNLYLKRVPGGWKGTERSDEACRT